jgi:hypothetical protein
MSHSAQKRSAKATPAGVAKEERTGRFAIEEARRGSTVLPPPGPDADLVSLEEVGAVALPEEPGESEVAPARGTVSGVFSAGVQTSAPPPIPAAALQPSPRLVDPVEEARRSERAQIQIEDLSLRPDNPFAASSLVPSPRKPISPAKVIGVIAVALAIASGAWFVYRAVTDAGPGAEVRSQAARVASRAIPRPTEPVPAVPVAPASERRVSAPGPIEAGAPVRPRVTRSAATEVAAKPEAKPVERAVAREQAPAPAVSTAAASEPVVEPQPAVVSAQPAVVAPATATQAPAPAGDTPSATSALAAPDQGEVLAAPLPLVPTREQVVAGFDAIQPELVRCAAGKHGVAQISATIAASGRISYALVGGKFQGTAEGSCMARVVRGARFPQFSQPTLKASYPVSL